MPTTQEIYDMTPTTLKQKVLHYLVTKGMFVDQAQDVLDIYMKQTEQEMQSRWDDSIVGYPTQFLAVLLMGVNLVALEYINKNCPKAWFRSMFDK